MQMKGAATTGLFGLGTQVFGDAPSTAEDKPSNDIENSDSHSDDETSEDGNEDDDDDDSLVTAMASTSIEGSPWRTAPCYPPLYMSTIPEYIPPAPKPKKNGSQQYAVDDDDVGKGKKDTSWALEGYENSLELDHVFERFTKRVGYCGHQCIRYVLNLSQLNHNEMNTTIKFFASYEFGGAPLPFAGDQIFNKIFPAPPMHALPVTKPDFMVVPPPPKRTFVASSLPPCPQCQSPRVFECQLMPNLINVLKVHDANASDGKKRQTDEERRKEVAELLKGGNTSGRRGMEWGTCIIFSCQKDCCEEKAKSVWREEIVLIQWDV